MNFGTALPYGAEVTGDASLGIYLDTHLTAS
jgi:hypothetical protein